MSLREAAGYLVQLRDLYALRWGSRIRRRRREYRRFAPQEVEAVLSTARTDLPPATRESRLQETRP